MGCEHCGEAHESSNLFCPNTGKLIPSQLLPEGTLIEGKYRIGPSIGVGGMGAVFEARHTLLDKRVAIKVMLPEGGPEIARQFSARMVREARAASATGHQNIAQVTDMGWVQEGSLFVVMEYLEGHTLRHLLEQDGHMSVGRAARLMGQVLAGLDVVHKNGIVHRDLKPENLMVVEDDEGQELIKILDFGISKQVKGGNRDLNLTSTGLVIGTPQYMSPEQAKNSAKIDLRTDIYSAGAILYRMVTGTLPHQAETLNALIAAVLAAPIDPPSRRRPGLPRALDDIVLKALAREPEQRYDSARAFRDVLRPLEAVAVVEDYKPASLPPPSVFGEVDESLLVDLDATSAPPAAAPAPVPESPPPAPQTKPSEPAGPAPAGAPDLFAPPEEEDQLALELDSGIGTGAPAQAQTRPAPPSPSTASAAAGGAAVDQLRSTGPYGQARRGHPPAGLWIALAVVVVAGFLIWRFGLYDGGQAAEVKPDAADYVEIRIDVSPRWAEVQVDGVQLTSNPLVLQRSSREYTVTVRAKGHWSQTLAVTPTENRSILVELKPRQQPPPLQE